MNSFNTKTEFSSLNSAEYIGEGTQAKIYVLPAGSLYRTAVVIKKYKKKILSGNEAAMESYLSELIKIKENASSGLMDLLNKYTTWPQKIIFDQGKACGYVMHLVPNIFYSEIEDPKGYPKKRKISSIDFFWHGKSYRKAQSLPLLSEMGRAMIVNLLLKIISTLHENKIVLGDLSPSNILIRINANNQKDNRLLFLDTDSFKLIGNVHPLRQLHTGDWIPPECRMALEDREALSSLARPDAQKLESLKISANIQNTATDVYRTCLLISRLYHDDENIHATRVLLSPSAQNNIRSRIGVDFLDNVSLGLSDSPNIRPTAKSLFLCYRDSLNRIIRSQR